MHLVQRVPPSGNQPQPQTSAQSQTTSSSSGANFGQGIGGGMPDVSQLIQHIIGGLGDLGQNATFNATTTVKNKYLNWIKNIFFFFINFNYFNRAMQTEWKFILIWAICLK